MGKAKSLIDLESQKHTKLTLAAGSMELIEQHMAFDSRNASSLLRGKWKYSDGAEFLHILEDVDNLYLDCNRLGQFVISKDGAKINYFRDTACPEEDFNDYFQKIIVPLAMQVANFYCFHASAIEVDGKAVLFIGPSGSGKSTTALACVSRGARLLCEDISPLTVRPKNPRTVLLQTLGKRPFRITTDAARYFAPNCPTKRTSFEEDKFELDLNTEPLIKSVEVRACIFLDKSADVGIRQLSLQDSIRSSLQNAFFLRFLPGFEKQKYFLKNLAPILERVDCYQLCLREDFLELSNFANRLVNNPKLVFESDSYCGKSI